MTVTGLGWQEALAAVKVARPCAGPNLGFQRQLQEFEATQADQVRGKMESVEYITALRNRCGFIKVVICKIWPDGQMISEVSMLAS